MVRRQQEAEQTFTATQLKSRSDVGGATRDQAVQISAHIQRQTNYLNQTREKTTAGHHLGGWWMALAALESLGFLNWAQLASLGSLASVRSFRGLRVAQRDRGSFWEIRTKGFPRGEQGA